MTGMILDGDGHSDLWINGRCGDVLNCCGVVESQTVQVMGGR